MKFPTILNKHFAKLKSIDNQIIVSMVKSTVENDMTIDTLVGNVTNILLNNECLQSCNDGSYNFKKALLIRVNLVVKALDFDTKKTVTTSIGKDGQMFTHTVITITGEREPEDFTKLLFTNPKTYESTITLKGSKKVIDNNSESLLASKATIKMRIKDINLEYLDLYTALLYENNKGKVKEPNYHNRLLRVCEETKGFLGYEYDNFRKLDSNTRNYPLHRHGFATEYGDSFEKFLIEPAKPYLVTAEEVQGAIEYLEDEFKADDYRRLVYDSIVKLDNNMVMLQDYNRGMNATFTIEHKELGKLLHIIDVFHNIICNEGNLTRSCVSFDFTNSGGINASNQFGDEKFLKTMNLLGGSKKFDTHQAIANVLDIERDSAKMIMQGPNHGGQVPVESREMVEEVFGETYKYIRMTAEYGKELAENGIKMVEIYRPDGVKAIWYPYTIDCDVAMEDGSTISAIMPYGGNGTNKELGLAVSLLHSSDAFVETYIQQNLMEEGIHIKTTLDNFYGAPSIKGKVVKYTFEALELLKGNMEKQLKLIEKQTGIYRGWNLPDRECELVASSNII